MSSAATALSTTRHTTRSMPSTKNRRARVLQAPSEPPQATLEATLEATNKKPRRARWKRTHKPIYRIVGTLPTSCM